MARTVTLLRTAAALGLAVLIAFGPGCGYAGAAGGGAAAGRHAGVRSAHPGDPYGHGGLLVRLPSGGSVRLQRGSAAGVAGLPFVPVPVLGPLLHGVRPGAGTGPGVAGPGAGAAGPGVPAAGTGRAGRAGAEATGVGGHGSAGGDAVGAARSPWGPVREGPPPLGPQALAPQPAAGALPELNVDAVRSAAGRDSRDERASRRLLPLGIGLALLGGGSALFGWRLRRI